ncbi:hypothetical protein BDV19DRAFT_387940 [Aspergillus venezuelensis]
MASEMDCPSTADRLFGPRVNTACRNFDFTVYFEDIFFACLPSALFLLCCLPSGYRLWNKPRRVERSTLLFWKVAALAALFGCQIGFLIERQTGFPGLRNDASLAADILEVVDTVAAAGLSYLHHCRSIRPSNLLVLFLSARSLLVIARVRTLWLINSYLYAAISSAIPLTLDLVFNLLSMILESVEKGPITLSKSKSATPEPFSGFWKLASFAWLSGIFRSGYSRIISVHDLPVLDPQLAGEKVVVKLLRDWANVENKSSKYALVRSCLRVYRGPFNAAVIPRLCLIGFTFCQPFLINATISWVGNQNAAEDSGKALIGAFALVYCGMAARSPSFSLYTIRLRGSLITLIHNQTVHTRAADLGPNTAITLMGTDVERIAASSRLIHKMWACLIEIGVAIYLLQRQIGVAWVVPGAIVLLFVLITFKLSAASNTAQRTWVEKVVDRLKVTSFALERIKEVKMLGLSEKLASIIRCLREAEIAASAMFRELLIVRVVLSASPTNLAPMATFVVYTVIALVRHDESILAAKAFTSTSLISLVTVPVLTFIQALPAVVQCLGCFDRIQEYCSTQDAHSPMTQERDRNMDKGLITLENITSDNIIPELQDQRFSWDRSSPFSLKDINLTIPPNAITMLIGPIGSGKTTLLESILGETIAIGASCKGQLPPVAYCSQTPWLRNQTIRQNILGELPMNFEWYRAVIKACGLEKDIAYLPRGDRTSVAGNGITLSGGQKQRIALARAVYSRHKIVLLDDVFSGVDAATTQHISSHLFGAVGLFGKLGVTVVLATHSKYLLQYAGNIIVLDNGRVLESGSPLNIKTHDSFIGQMEDEIDTDLEPTVSRTSTLPTPPLTENPKDTTVLLAELDHDTDKIDSAPEQTHQIQSSTRQEGDWSIYAFYASASGRGTVLLCLLSAMGWAFCSEFATVWFDIWTDANAEYPNPRIGMYLGIYVFLGFMSVLFMIGTLWLLIVNVVSTSALSLHEMVLGSTFWAPIQFFHDVDIGSITNRFSQDMDLIDISLPIEVFNVIAYGCDCLAKLVILCVFAKYLSVPIPFAAAVIYFVQKFYLRTSRQLRFLDIEAKAPLYSHFLSLVKGASTVRAYNWQNSFHQTCINLLGTSQRPVYFLYCVQQCLGFFLDMLVASLAVVLISTVVFLKEKFDPGDVGVALVMVMTFNTALMQLVKDWTNMETSVGAVARVKAFRQDTPIEAACEARQLLPDNWPANGDIEISGVVASHAPESEPVLKRISIDIRAGEKIAICGSSGSGKTSLILSLLGMVEVEEGSITIDEINIQDQSRAIVREKLNVVAQDPFIMAGSVRFNVDPFEKASDERVFDALNKLGLLEKIQQDDGLGADLNPSSWSQGQSQLLCLARAMVQEGKVLILDEAMSRYIIHNHTSPWPAALSASQYSKIKHPADIRYCSVYDETEDIMQDAIDTKFTSHTVLAVMHRLRHIERYDRVAVLEKGVLVEFGPPCELLSRESRFRILWESTR